MANRAREGMAIRRATPRVVAMMLLSLFLVVGAATQAHAVITVSKTGSFGSLLSYAYVVCTAGDSNVRQVTAPGTTVTRAPRYSTSTQVISAIAHIEYSDGTSWHHYTWGTWRSASVAPGKNASLSGQTFTVPRGYSWRVSTTYQWQVGSTIIGQVVNYYERLDHRTFDYRSNSAIAMLQGPVTVGATAPGQASWCTLP
jgi:hypothetical protein